MRNMTASVLDGDMNSRVSISNATINCLIAHFKNAATVGLTVQNLPSGRQENASISFIYFKIGGHTDYELRR